MIKSVPVPENMNWLLINLIHSGYAHYESFVDGTLNLWDVIKLSQLAEYDRCVKEVVENYRMQEIDKQKSKRK